MTASLWKSFPISEWICLHSKTFFVCQAPVLFCGIIWKSLPCPHAGVTALPHGEFTGPRVGFFFKKNNK